jgi:hypothetical protein
MKPNFLRNLIAAAGLFVLTALTVIGGAIAVTPYDGTRNFPARFFSTQQVHYYRFTVNFNDPQIGTFQQIGTVGKAAFITNVEVEVVTAFNAGTTNTLTVGTTSTNINEIVSSADLTGNGSSSLSTQVTRVTRGFGRSLTASGDTGIFVKYAQTGTAATNGQAIVVITWVPNNDQ